MANTLIPIQSYNLTSASSSVTFSNIPQTYTDLVIKISVRQTAAFPFSTFLLSLNSTTTSFTVRYGEGDGATAASGTSPARYVMYANAANSTTNAFSCGEIYFPEYKSSNFKNYIVDAAGEQNAATSYIDTVSGLWSNTSAITSITFTPASGNFDTYSSFHLYGISKI